ncbi:MAG: hypothetical protein K1060chlam4_00450 [Candidatus Anoxychlamydiales bacterium]|nr:hypothetical protein [Candidatus Anoxychlamydiales bacterium]
MNNKIKIIDFGSSKVSYISAQPDLDLYLIKKNLMEFFYKPKEILNFKKKIDLETIDFIQLKQFIIEKISNSSSRFRVLSKVLPDNYRNEIDSIKQNLYEKIKINDLKLIFSFFPIEPYRDLFPLDDHMKFFLERKIPLRAKLNNPIFTQFRQFEITQNDF